MSPESKEKWIVLQPLILSVMMAIGIMVGFKMNEKSESSLIEDVPYNEGHRMIGRVEELIRFVENKYVDQVDSEVLIDEALFSVFRKLDPHSVYIAPSELEDINDQMNGSFFGIGIETFMIDDTVHICGVLPDSPAGASNIKVFDKIVAIDDSIVAGKDFTFDKVRSMLRRKNGKPVKLDILRKGTGISVDIIPSIIPVRTVLSSFIVDDSIAYIHLDRFGSHTYKEFMEVVETLFTKDKAKHLILDLRGNPGGYLPEATNILCQIFEEKNQLLVYTEGKNNKRNEYKSTGKRFFSINEVAVLIDENSASASEIIAGAIQDWDRGVIIGRRSFGKGLVQEQYDLNNGGAIRLTVARYYTPSGRSIQKSYHDIASYDNDIHDRFANGYLFDRDSLLTQDTTCFYSKKLKRKLLSSGGINPDIFIPLDSVFLSDDLMQIESVIPEYVFKQMSEAKVAPINALKDVTEIRLNDDFYAALVTYAEVKGKYSPAILEKSFSSMIKSFIVKYSLGAVEAAISDADYDPGILTARDFIKKAKSLKQLQ